jgi:hypothetical protein
MDIFYCSLAFKERPMPRYGYPTANRVVYLSILPPLRPRPLSLPRHSNRQQLLQRFLHLFEPAFDSSNPGIHRLFPDLSDLNNEGS